MLTGILKGSLREDEQDYLHRYGGDEFTLIAPGVSIEEARLMGDRLRKIVHTLGNGITISFGVAQYGVNKELMDYIINKKPDRVELTQLLTEESRGLVRRATNAVFKAKEYRNAVAIWDPKNVLYSVYR